MLDAQSECDASEAIAGQARADLAQAMAGLRDRLTPAHLLHSASQSAHDAVAPLVAPLLAQAKSSGGIIVLASAAAALFYGLGRSGAGHAAPAAKPERPAAADPVTAKASPAPAPGRSGGSLGKALLISAIALAAGAAMGAGLPVTGREKNFGRRVRRDMGDWARNNSGQVMSQAVNAFGVAKGLGSLLALMAFVAAHFEASADHARQRDMP